MLLNRYLIKKINIRLRVGVHPGVNLGVGLGFRFLLGVGVHPGVSLGVGVGLQIINCIHCIITYDFDENTEFMSICEH